MKKYLLFSLPVAAMLPLASLVSCSSDNEPNINNNENSGNNQEIGKENKTTLTFSLDKNKTTNMTYYLFNVSDFSDKIIIQKYIRNINFSFLDNLTKEEKDSLFNEIFDFKITKELDYVNVEIQKVKTNVMINNKEYQVLFDDNNPSILKLEYLDYPLLLNSNLQTISSVDPISVLGQTKNLSADQVFNLGATFIQNNLSENDKLEIKKITSSIIGINNSNVFTKDVNFENYRNYFDTNFTSWNISKNYEIKTYFLKSSQYDLKNFTNFSKNLKISIVLINKNTKEQIHKQVIEISGFKPNLAKKLKNNTLSQKQMFINEMNKQKEFWQKYQQILNQDYKEAPLWVFHPIIDSKFQKLFDINERKYLIGEISVFLERINNQIKLVWKTSIYKWDYEAILKLNKTKLKLLFANEEGAMFNVDGTKNNNFKEPKLIQSSENGLYQLQWDALANQVLKDKAQLIVDQLNKDCAKIHIFSAPIDFNQQPNFEIKYVGSKITTEEQATTFNNMNVNKKFELFQTTSLIENLPSINMESCYKNVNYDFTNKEFNFEINYQIELIKNDKQEVLKTYYTINQLSVIPSKKLKYE